jgi:D-alanyl-D-alanine carboxypeptidase (penicillin-binding protein 5/6)
VRVIARFWKSRWASYILALLIFSLFCEGLIFKNVSAQPNSTGEAATLEIQARAAILVNADTGQILYEYNIHERFPHASLTKIMTLLIAMDSLDSGEISFTDVVTISKEASNVVGSRIWLSEGDKISVEDLMKAVAVPSANDASYALAQHIAGSEENFVRMMNDKAKAMDLKDTHFKDSTGIRSLFKCI